MLDHGDQFFVRRHAAHGRAPIFGVRCERTLYGGFVLRLLHVRGERANGLVEEVVDGRGRGSVEGSERDRDLTQPREREGDIVVAGASSRGGRGNSARTRHRWSETNAARGE